MTVQNVPMAQDIANKFDTATARVETLTADTPLLISAANPGRKHLFLENTSETEKVTIHPGEAASAVVGTGYVINPGGSTKDFNMLALYTGDVSVVSSGAATISIVEA